MRELHVAKHGCDQNPGTADEPFLTIGRAACVAVENDVVIVHEGVYREWVNPKNGGRDHYHRIVYAAAENEKVVIKGSEVIGNWKKTSDHVWEAEVDNRLFGDYNPFRELLAGDWMIKPNNPFLHLGKVYINGVALCEKLHLDLVETAEMSWFAQVQEEKTVIFANFGELDPTGGLTEINVRKGCFYPDKNGVNYITVRGFEMAHAACPWSPPTAVQPGMIWTHWSKGWIIENNILHDARCSAISVGKEETTGDNLSWKFHRKPAYQYQQEAAFSALRYGWSKELIGSHIIRNNVIYDCGQNGVVGNLGGAFCEIYGNHIYNIANTGEIIEGHEMGGIKLHAPIDTYIHNNYIHDTFFGIWLDWQAQGVRVSANLMRENGTDLVLEGSHGPHLIDNNIFASHCCLHCISQGSAMVHNLFYGSITYKNLKADFNRYRSLPYHLPHSTQIMGTAMLYGADDRVYHNIFVKSGKYEENENNLFGTMGYEGCPVSMEEYIDRVMKKKATLVSFNVERQPAYVNRNCYVSDAKAFSGEEENAFCDDAVIAVSEEEGKIYVEVEMPESFLKLHTEIMGTHNLGITRISEQAFENADGSEIRLDADYFGCGRSASPTPGPFEGLKAGYHKICVYENTVSVNEGI